ncbi:VOC family protein [Aeromonas encheleia]|uniref:VOC family protein n=1 Tax=Aeromonas encheleia TaxID=73010 RepID=A0AAE9MKN6_9GAMM|nr:VOC family protein [Aeromonas encheleia]USV59296.1 VOC family protein [Aeromonas encheleia]
MNIAIHFEIPVRDLARAIRFYEGVFEIALERVQIDGNEMALFPLFEGMAGCSGALAKGDSYVPSLDGSRIYLTVVDIELAMIRVLQRGGESLYPITRVSDSIRVAEFKDPEGNRIALQEIELSKVHALST